MAALASRVANAVSARRVHVEPMFLSAEALAAARADMDRVFGHVEDQDGTPDFESIQTDLLNPEFRQTLAPLPFAQLLSQVDELQIALGEGTGRRFLSGGGLHLMRYPVGSKFMRHVDEDPALYEPVRNSISFLIYLTPPDWKEEDGGTLCVFEGAADSDPRRILPESGTLVVYDSTLEHEVLPTRRERHLVSGRFRELDEDWRRGRG